MQFSSYTTISTTQPAQTQQHQDNHHLPPELSPGQSLAHPGAADEKPTADRGGCGKAAWAKDPADEEVWGVILVVEVLDVKRGDEKNGEPGRSKVRRVVVEAD